MLELFHVKKDIPFMRWARSTIFVSVASIQPRKHQPKMERKFCNKTILSKQG